MQHKMHQNHPKSLPLRPDFSSTRGWPPNSKGSQCVDLLSSSWCDQKVTRSQRNNRQLVAADDEQGSNGYLLKLSYLICLVRTLFNESFHVTHATPSTVCQKIPSLKKVSPLCQLLQPRNEYGPHQSPSGWRWSIPGRWHMVTPWEIPSWYDSRCDLRKLWNFRKPFLTCLTCLRFSLIIEVVYIYI